MFCHKCGNAAAEGMVFCNKCGAKFVVLESTPQASVESATIVEPTPIVAPAPIVEPVQKVVVEPVPPTYEQPAQPTSGGIQIEKDAINFTVQEAFELLEANSSRCPKIKSVLLKQRTNVKIVDKKACEEVEDYIVIKGDLCTYDVNIAGGDVSVNSSYKWFSPIWIISYIIFIGSMIGLNAFGYYWGLPAIVPWLIWGGIVILDWIIMRLISKPENNTIFSYVGEILGIKLKK